MTKEKVEIAKFSNARLHNVGPRSEVVDDDLAFYRRRIALRAEETHSRHRAALEGGDGRSYIEKRGTVIIGFCSTHWAPPTAPCPSEGSTRRILDPSPLFAEGARTCHTTLQPDD